MRPGIRETSLQTFVKTAVQLNRQAVIVAEAGVIDLGDPAVTRIRTGRAISGSRISTGGAARAVKNRVSDRSSQGADIQIPHAVKPHAAAPQVRNVKAHSGGQLPLDPEIALVGVRIPQVLIRENDVHGSRRRSERSRRKEVRVHGPGGELRRGAAVIRDRLLMDVIVDKKRIDQAGLNTREEDTVSAAEQGFS